MAKQKQTPLPGMENRQLDDLEQAAEQLIERKDAHKTAGVAAKEAEKELIKLMRKHNRETYKYHGLEIYITPGEDKALVKRVHDEETEGEQEQAAKQTAGDQVN